MNDIIVKTQALKKYYYVGNHIVKAIDGIDFVVKKGEFVSIIGKSGSGKSTLLHMIGGLDIPSEGTVIVDDIDLSKMNNEQMAIFRRRKVGFVFQQYNLIPDLNVYENITFPLKLDGAYIDQQFIQELLKNLNISDKKEMYPTMLSGGEQQRVAIARLLLKPCELILADEPTGNLDYENKEKVFNLLKAFNQSGKTVIIVTHDIELAKKCHKIYQMDQGKLSNYAN